MQNFGDLLELCTLCLHWPLLQDSGINAELIFMCNIVNYYEDISSNKYLKPSLHFWWRNSKRFQPIYSRSNVWKRSFFSITIPIPSSFPDTMVGAACGDTSVMCTIPILNSFPDTVVWSASGDIYSEYNSHSELIPRYNGLSSKWRLICSGHNSCSKIIPVYNGFSSKWRHICF